MLENKYVKAYDCHYSRFIASWRNSGGKSSHQFKKWLRQSFPDLTNEDISAMHEMMTCGKLEMEISAERWLKEHE